MNNGADYSDGQLSIASGFQAFLTPPKQSGWFRGEIAYHVDGGGRIDMIDEMKIVHLEELSHPHPIQTLMASQEPLGEPFAAILHDNLWELYEK